MFIAKHVRMYTLIQLVFFQKRKTVTREFGLYEDKPLIILSEEDWCTVTCQYFGGHF